MPGREYRGAGERYNAFIATPAGLLRQVQIPVSHGSLEGVLQTGEADVRVAAVVCHPDPLRGGTMHNKVVFHAGKAFGSLGWPVLRFNFRGVGASTGAYGGGRGEREDLLAAMDFLGWKRLVVAGFSFGSAVAFAVGASDARAVALCAIGLPVVGREAELEAARRSTKPKLVVQGSEDELAAAADAARWIEGAMEPKQLEVVPGADHFFTGYTEPLKAAIISFFGALHV